MMIPISNSGYYPPNQQQIPSYTTNNYPPQKQPHETFINYPHSIAQYTHPISIQPHTQHIRPHLIIPAQPERQYIQPPIPHVQSQVTHTQPQMQYGQPTHVQYSQSQVTHTQPQIKYIQPTPVQYSQPQVTHAPQIKYIQPQIVTQPQSVAAMSYVSDINSQPQRIHYVTNAPQISTYPPMDNTKMDFDKKNDATNNQIAQALELLSNKMNEISNQQKASHSDSQHILQNDQNIDNIQSNESMDHHVYEIVGNVDVEKILYKMLFVDNPQTCARSKISQFWKLSPADTFSVLDILKQHGYVDKSIDGKYYINPKYKTNKLRYNMNQYLWRLRNKYDTQNIISHGKKKTKSKSKPKSKNKTYNLRRKKKADQGKDVKRRRTPIQQHQHTHLEIVNGLAEHNREMSDIVADHRRLREEEKMEEAETQSNNGLPTSAEMGGAVQEINNWFANGMRPPPPPPRRPPSPNNAEYISINRNNGQSQTSDISDSESGNSESETDENNDHNGNEHNGNQHNTNQHNGNQNNRNQRNVNQDNASEHDNDGDDSSRMSGSDYSQSQYSSDDGVISDGMCVDENNDNNQ
eukprot:483748_1